MQFEAFPVEVLPEPVKSFVEIGATALGCDPTYVALPVLSAVAGAIGNTRRIELKRGWSEPAIVWTGTVGESGTLKTPAIKLATEPLTKLQAEAFQQHEQDMKAYKIALEEFEEEKQRRRRSKSGAGSGEPLEKPEKPAAVRYTVSDITVEALAPILNENPRGVLLMRDELAGWLGSFDRYAGKAGADRANWLSMNSGEAITVDRKTGEPRTIYVPRAVVSVTGGIQPGILDRVLDQADREAGLLARILLAMPPSRPKRWSEDEVPEGLQAKVLLTFRKLIALEHDRTNDDELKPRLLAMTHVAKEAWKRFVNDHGRAQNDLTGDIRAAFSKLEAYAARFALVFHCVRVAAADPTLSSENSIDEDSINAGVTLARWFGHELRRIYGHLGASETDRENAKLIELINRQGGSVSVRDWQYNRTHATSEDAKAELEALVQAGFGRWDDPPKQGPGRPKSPRFVLFRASDNSDTDKTPADDA